MLSIDVSSSLKMGKLYPYVSTFAGFNNRTEGFSDEFRFGFETGLSIGNFTGIFKVFGIRSFRNGSLDDNLFYSGLLVNNSEYLILSPELAYNFSKKWGLSFNYSKAVSGRLMFVSPAYTIGVFLELK